jgi:hypothetical protein
MRALRRYAVGAFSPHRRLALAGSRTLIYLVDIQLLLARVTRPEKESLLHTDS